MRRIIVTSALPYANGSIHLGHLVEYLQTDIWVRSQKMAGNDCVYICADDSHGTPIMLKAKELGVTPEELIKNTYNETTTCNKCLMNLYKCKLSDSKLSNISMT